MKTIHYSILIAAVCSIFGTQTVFASSEAVLGIATRKAAHVVGETIKNMKLVDTSGTVLDTIEFSKNTPDVTPDWVNR